MTRPRPRLIDRVPSERGAAPDEILDRFLSWVADVGLEPYPAQEEAFLELISDRHVILGTPTGSGKSLVAALLHFRAMCEWQRSFYTSPTKALASEKFFWLCGEFGPENVGMLTGDASINPDSPIVCCTMEVLANMALRRGEETPAPYVIMDEFHYYADRARGMAWQLPLLALPKTLFLLMSATLGDTSGIARSVRERTGRELTEIHSDQRPVPLDFTYRETPLHETVEELLREEKAPIYIVHFTQREAAERAQALTSAPICTREERRLVADETSEFRFDSPYGKEFKRLIGAGVGVHHAGLLPKYRLLVEQLAQRGLLKVICGTDTLGVGVNIPIRTVLFSRLSKFDGRKVAVLKPREFKQIAGRAGRKGFDDRGSVVCQAPEHVIENRRIAAKSAAAGGRRRKPGRKRSPPRDFVAWNEDTFQRLIHQPPEPLESRFSVSHGMMVQILQRSPTAAGATGYRAVIDLIDLSHERERTKPRMKRHAAVVFRSLRRAGIAELVRDGESGPFTVRISGELQFDFSLYRTLSLYLVDAISALDLDAPGYAMELLSLVESILDDPIPILIAQRQRLRRDLLATLKAEGVPYEERIRHLDEVTHPKPEAEFIYATYQIFAEKHPWLQAENIHPKSIAREIFESRSTFDQYVRDYSIARGEGRLLRYLGDVYRTLTKNVPEWALSEELLDVTAFFRAMLEGVDSSLFEEWQSLRNPAAADARSPGGEPDPRPPPDELVVDARARTTRIRAELHRLVRALRDRDYERAARCVRQDLENGWDAARFERELEPFYEEHDQILFTPRARLAEYTVVRECGELRWEVSQVLLDPDDENLWCVEGEVDLSAGVGADRPLVELRRIGT